MQTCLLIKKRHEKKCDNDETCLMLQTFTCIKNLIFNQLKVRLYGYQLISLVLNVRKKFTACLVRIKIHLYIMFNDK